MKCIAFALLSAASVLVSQSAVAADISPVTKAPIVSRAYDWSGLYVGANLGWGWASADWTNTANTTLFGDSVPPNGFSHAAQGVVGGGQIGFNVQTGSWVYGVEVLLDATGIDGKRTSTVGAADDQFTGSVEALLLLTGRVGYSVDNWLAYLKGGYAGAHVRAAVSDTVGPSTGSGSSSQWRSGWTIGGGVEYGLTRSLSLGFEYNYVELQSGSHELGGGTGSYAWDVRLRRFHLMLAKLSYRFNSLP